MPPVYPTATKAARMQALITLMGATAVLELGTTAMAIIIDSITLSATPATVAGPVITFSGFPKNANAAAAGRIATARVRTQTGGTDVITGFTCGLTASAAPAWVALTAYTVGQYRTNGANQYKCTAAGTSASSGGPTGTGSGITDGSVTWDYCSPANADVQLDNIDVNLGQVVTVSAGSITHA